MITLIRNTCKYLTVISNSSPNAIHNIIITSEVGDHKSQSKVTAHLLNNTINRGYIENNPINNPNKKLVELIFNELSFILTQTTYTLQDKPIEVFETGNYDLRGDIITRCSKQNKDIHGSEYQFETLSYLKQPIKRVK